MKKFLTGMLIGLMLAIIPVSFAINVAPKKFSDVKSSDWFYQAVSVLSAAGVLTGYDDGSFKPSNQISRAETAQMVYNAYVDLDVRGTVNSLVDQVEALQAKVNTLDLPGNCYYNNEWYQTDEKDSADFCTCLSNGIMNCPSAY